MALTLIGHQPIDFTYGLDGCEEISSYCVHYETNDRPQFQFRNSIGDNCGFLIFIRNTDGSGLTQIEDYTTSGIYVTATVDFISLGLEAGCYEIVLYELCDLYGSNLVTNGTFTYDLTGWTVTDKITVSISSFTYESEEDANDGSITVSASGGTAPYTYSIDGITFQAGTTFSSLSSGTYTITVKDTNDLLGQVTFNMAVAINCSELSGIEANATLLIDAYQYLTCEANDFI
jgi:hypothetical protein